VIVNTLRSISFAAVAVLLIVIVTYAQVKPQTESQRLTDETLTLVREKRYDDAIRTAEQAVKLERNRSPLNRNSLAAGLMNLARLIRLRQQQSSEIRKQNFSKSPLSTIEWVNLLADRLEQIYREAIELYGRDSNNSTQQATAMFELADYTSFDRDLMRSDGDRFRKTEQLYLDALELLERSYGVADERALSGTSLLADFYRDVGEFEKSLPLYLKFITGVETKIGKNSKALEPALLSAAEILSGSFQTEQAESYVQRLTDISGKPQVLPEYSLNLTSRTKQDHESKMMGDSRTIRTYLKTLKWLPVNVTVDENGKVISAEPEPTSEVDIDGRNVRDRAQKEVRDWKFKPFSIDGINRKMRGKVLFSYLVKA